MKNKMKTVLLSLLSLVFGFSFLVGCSKDRDKFYYQEAELPKTAYFAYTDNQTKSNYNSELFYRNDTAQKFGDPCAIMIEEGEYAGWIYALGSDNIGKVGFDAYRTKDFTEWEKVGTIYSRTGNHFGHNAFWAPQLLWDKDAKYEDYYIDKEDGEDGTGLYFLFYSVYSKTTFEPNFKNDSTTDDIYPGVYYLCMAVSKSPDGPFVEFTGKNRNGLEMDASTPLFNLEYIDKSLDEKPENSGAQALLKERRSFIDACPFIAPNGDKYLYMARNTINDTTNEIWGVKMIDWATPDYSTVTRLTSHGYVNKYSNTSENVPYEYEWASKKIDEGPFMIYNEVNQKYYITFSLGGTEDKIYPVCQAIGDTPLGPFTKIQPTKGGLICAPGLDWDMNGSGHHSFLYIGDELYMVYHTHPMDLEDGTIDFRGQAYDKIHWMTNEDGQLVMHANGPTKTVQAKPKYYTGYENIAPLASVKATNGAKGTDAKYLTDGLVKMHGADVEDGWADDNVKEFEAKKDTVITLAFDDYVTVRSLMIYNSYLYQNIFTSIKKISLYYRDANGKTGIATIKDLKFDVTGNTVPLELYFKPDELVAMTEEEKAEYYTTRPGGAAIVEFNEFSVNKITIEVKKSNKKLCISDVVVLGKTA